MINMVCDGLYIGDSEAASELGMLEELKIERIISLGNEKEVKKYKYFENIEYLKIVVDDVDNENIGKYFAICNKFISLGFDSDSANVLVHCHKGVSRSATIVIAYLMYTYKTDFYAAFQKLRSVRPIVKPNAGFMKQLQEYQLGN